eukprot:CAMPEP_0171295204 /NCGR_PEP_ID=MMETSP0816-20121228/3818_1 /TAXON_ID=420281 /ORGANISM="Proboscia inermis, Strain CCAP1064/1" /LENGTH=304 /DNA_ID=CAMNT_0011767707 /DNA_START=419 /DNA_END=1333 /DNA_ORIENTATION=-
MRIQLFYRMIKAKCDVTFLREYRAAKFVQAQWRMLKPKRHMKKYKKASALLQRVIRRKKNIDGFKAKMIKVVDAARKDAKVQALQQQLSNENCSLVDDEILRNDSLEIITYLREELRAQRSLVSDLSNAAMEKSKESRLLEFNYSSMEAIRAASKQQNTELMLKNKVLFQNIATMTPKMVQLKQALKEEQVNAEQNHSASKEDFMVTFNSQSDELEQVKAELKRTKENLYLNHRTHAQDMMKLRDGHDKVINDMSDQLLSAETAQAGYMTKLMDVLDSSQIENDGKLEDPETLKQKRIVNFLSN